MEERNGNSKKVLAALAVLVLVAVMVLGVKALSPKEEAPAAAQSTQTTSGTEGSAQGGTSASQTAQETAGSTTASNYKDGTFSATGGYRSPGGQQSIKISLTVQDGKVTGSTAESGANDPTSRSFQEKFISGYKDLVVGKSLDEISLDKVSGSSLTPQGFDDALQQIKDQAKA